MLRAAGGHLICPTAQRTAVALMELTLRLCAGHFVGPDSLSPFLFPSISLLTSLFLRVQMRGSGGGDGVVEEHEDLAPVPGGAAPGCMYLKMMFP